MKAEMFLSLAVLCSAPARAAMVAGEPAAAGETPAAAAAPVATEVLLFLDEEESQKGSQRAASFRVSGFYLREPAPREKAAFTLLPQDGLPVSGFLIDAVEEDREHGWAVRKASALQQGYHRRKMKAHYIRGIAVYPAAPKARLLPAEKIERFGGHAKHEPAFGVDLDADGAADLVDFKYYCKNPAAPYPLGDKNLAAFDTDKICRKSYRRAPDGWKLLP